MSDEWGELLLLPDRHDLDYDYPADNVPLDAGLLMMIGMSMTYAKVRKRKRWFNRILFFEILMIGKNLIVFCWTCGLIIWTKILSLRLPKHMVMDDNEKEIILQETTSVEQNTI